MGILVTCITIIHYSYMLLLYVTQNVTTCTLAIENSKTQGCTSGVPNLPSSAAYLNTQLLSAEISNLKWYLRSYGRLG